MTIISIWKRMHARIVCLGCPHAQEIRSLRTSIDTVRKKVYRDGLRDGAGAADADEGQSEPHGQQEPTTVEAAPDPVNPVDPALTGEALALSQCANTLRSISNGR